MTRAAGTRTSEQLVHLRHLTAALGDAVTIDDVARAALTSAMRIDGVLRAGLALAQGNGRELRFVPSDEGALGESTVRWCLIDAYADVPLTEAVRTGAEVYVHSPTDLVSRYPGMAPRQIAMGTRAMAALPLVRSGERIGGLLLCFDSERDFPDEERAFLGAFAAQVTQAVRRGLAYQIQQTNSEQLQRSLLPRSVPELEGLALGSHYQPGGLNVDVGGDWYDVMALPDGSVVVSLGDVMGKGVPAAVVMSEVRAAMRAYALLDPTPGVVLSRLDRLVSSLTVPEQIVTMLYGLVSADRSSMRLGVAGHPMPLLVPEVGEATVFPGEIGAALGVGAGSWPENVLDLSDGTTVVLFSDGLVESRHLELGEGLKRLRARVSTLASRRRHPRELCARLAGLIREDQVDDDVTILALSATAGRRERSASTTLPASPSAARLARGFVRGQLSGWGVDDEVTSVAELCVSELVTNAVIHSGTEPEVTVRVDDECLIVLVHDRGKSGAVQRDEDYDPLSVSGRGLTLIDALATTWSAEHNPDGTTVWFELALVGADSVQVGASVGAG